jgi:Spy/CpxP family protein refolding chaperone
MLRKVTLGLIAAASLGAAALAPSAASAHGFHGGWHHGWGYGGFGIGGIYVNTGVSDCYQQRYIQTRHGVRLRTVNVCGYNVY